MNEVLDTRLMHPRDQITMVIARIYNRGLTTTSGGNISIIDENGDIWVTPSAVDKGSLQPYDIICVKKDGTKIGPHKPSSAFTETLWEVPPTCGMKKLKHSTNRSPHRLQSPPTLFTLPTN